MKLRYLLPLVLAVPSLGSVTPGNTVTCVVTGATVQSCSAVLAVTAGDTVVVWTANRTPSPRAQYSASDDCGNTYSEMSSTTTVTPPQMFIARNVTGTSCDITVQRTVVVNDQAFSWMAQTFSGVVNVGTPVRSPGATAPSGTATACSTTVTTTAANSYVESGFEVGLNGGLVINVTAGTIAQTRYNYSNTVRLTQLSTQSTSAGQQITQSLNFNGGTASTNCNAISIELIPSGIGGRNALPGDQMQTILMQTAGAANYGLPDSVLSPTWCTWFMPNGGGTYNIVPGSTKTLNGQAGQMGMPHWQMTRLCQDNLGNYWANPPLVAGANVTITPSPTAITISSSTTGGGGGTTVIASGQSSLQAYTFPAGACNPTILTIPASGVLATDVVNWSYGGGTIGGNWIEVIHTGAYATAGNVNFKSCNSRNDSSQTTTTQSINWQVVR